MSRNTTAMHESAASPSVGRFPNVALWIVQALTAASFLFAAVAKFAGEPTVVATFDAIGVGDWLRYFVGCLEALGAIAVLVPRLAGLAGLALVALMAGAALTHLVIIGEGTEMTAPFLLLSVVVAWGRRHSIGGLARSAASLISQWRDTHSATR